MEKLKKKVYSSTFRSFIKATCTIINKPYVDLVDSILQGKSRLSALMLKESECSMANKDHFKKFITSDTKRAFRDIVTQATESMDQLIPRFKEVELNKQLVASQRRRNELVQDHCRFQLERKINEMHANDYSDIFRDSFWKPRDQPAKGKASLEDFTADTQDNEIKYAQFVECLEQEEKRLLALGIDDSSLELEHNFDFSEEVDGISELGLLLKELCCHLVRPVQPMLLQIDSVCISLQVDERRYSNSIKSYIKRNIQPKETSKQ